MDDDLAIAEIASGTFSKEIAQRYGVTPRAVRKRLALHPEYAQAVKDQAASIVEEATHSLFRKDLDPSEVPIARARVDAAHKWAAARDPATWSGKPDYASQSITVNIQQFVVNQADKHALPPAVLDAIQDARDGSPVALPLVDSGGDKSACSGVSEGSYPQEGTPDGTR